MIYFNKITFKNDGSIDEFWGNQVKADTDPMPFNINNINSPIIVLAQKIARKNRFILDVEDETPGERAPNTYNSVDSLGAVNSLVQNLAAEINDAVRGMNWDRWDKLKKEAIREGWMHIDQQTEEIIDWGNLVLKFNESKAIFSSK